MRRLFLIFLLTLLPLQSGWAAACGYCPDQCISEAGSLATPEQHDDAIEVAEAADPDCGACQAGGSGVGGAVPATPFLSPLHSVALYAQSDFVDSCQLERPERPNWTRLA